VAILPDSSAFADSSPLTLRPTAPLRTSGSVTTVLGISLALLVLVAAAIAGIWCVVAGRKQTTGTYSFEVEMDQGSEELTSVVLFEEPFEAVTASQSCGADIGELGFEESVFPTF
jgi:hypothetical protein